MTYLLIGALIIAIIFGILQRRENNRILNSIDGMLTSAQDGNYYNYEIDESMMSKVEIKFNEFLTSSNLTTSALEREKDVINSLIADISHQIKTPLSNMILYSELIKEKESLSDFGKESIELILYQGEKLNFLIASLVRMSRLETGIITLNPISNDITPLVHRVIDQLKEKSNKKSIEIIFNPVDTKAYFD